MGRLPFLCLFLILSCVTFLVGEVSAQGLGGFSAESDKIVRAVKIRGNDRIDSATILYYIKTREDEPLRKSTVRRDIEQIFSLGQFKDIKVETRPLEDGVEVIYVVEEIPSIGDVSFVGNTQVENKDLRKAISLKRGATFKEHLVQDTVEKVKGVYEEKGYFFAESRVTTTASREGIVNVTVHIKEGEKVSIEEIRFKGNKSIDADDLEDQMETESETFLSFLDESGIYKKDILKLDLLRIEAYYQDHGFVKVRVLDPKIDINRKEKAIYITIPVQEGPQYRVGKIKVTEDDTYSEEELLSVVKLKPGDIYDISKLRKDIITITDLYSARGYAYADVLPDTKLDDQKKLVDLEVKVNRGRKVYVGEINIAGNTKTRDNVIRREFRIQEGQLFDSLALKRTKQRINNLQFFEDVKIDTHRGKESDLIDINTTVTERPTGSLSLGAGFSSVENFIFNASITQDNLFGRGQRLNFSTDLSSRRTNFNLNFTDPRIFDSTISLGVDLFSRQSNSFSFEQLSTGAGLRFGKSLGEYNWVGLAYQFQEVEVTNIQAIDISSDFRNGTFTTSRIQPTLIRDTRDNFLNPSNGQRHVLRFDVAGGVLGGSDFIKSSYEVSYYYPLIEKLVFAAHAEIKIGDGYNNQELPLFERYFMGGASSLRGFTIQEVGPRNSVGSVLGGDQSLLFNLELQYPITNEFRLFGFYDRGNVYGSGFDISRTAEVIDIGEMRHSTGAGVRFLSPFGPIGVAYGFKLDQRTGESSGEFHFSAGSAF
ncbi:MAG: outer membrane protein assembly factor BamA [Candidatus Nitronauta litoralis]|uniref:Outer membrane protein assembly factor BamA n=1 Tax=Candidatus Nitronauta litoralis TaxID=2705533 RepID=A0A7T0BUH8_9BACT|nr:MAG: outer membrane protein assembly factor BamA [Candidatus Nitronauta litoralis]